MLISVALRMSVSFALPPQLFVAKAGNFDK